jgi:hypothetical protein
LLVGKQELHHGTVDDGQTRVFEVLVGRGRHAAKHAPDQPGDLISLFCTHLQLQNDN